MIEFQWKDVKSYDMEEEGMAFSFEYNRPGKKPRNVQILTPYVSMIDLIISSEHLVFIRQPGNQGMHNNIFTWIHCCRSIVFLGHIFFSVYVFKGVLWQVVCIMFCLFFSMCIWRSAFAGWLQYVLFVFQYVYMKECFDRVFEEKEWEETEVSVLSFMDIFSPLPACREDS